jgi:hypothetical protein
MIINSRDSKLERCAVYAYLFVIEDIALCGADEEKVSCSGTFTFTCASTLRVGERQSYPIISAKIPALIAPSIKNPYVHVPQG